MNCAVCVSLIIIYKWNFIILKHCRVAANVVCNLMSCSYLLSSRLVFGLSKWAGKLNDFFLTNGQFMIMSSTRAYEFLTIAIVNHGGSRSNFLFVILTLFLPSCIDEKSSVKSCALPKKISVIFNDETLLSATTTTTKNCDYNNLSHLLCSRFLTSTGKICQPFSLSLFLTCSKKKEIFVFFCIGR